MNGEDEKNPVKRDIHNDHYDNYIKKRADEEKNKLNQSETNRDIHTATNYGVRKKAEESSDWDDSNDIHEFPTNAFGLCEFINEDAGSDKPAKYVRLSGASHFLRPIKTYQHIIEIVDLGIKYPMFADLYTFLPQIDFPNVNTNFVKISLGLLM